MAKLLFKLHDVDDDEADEVRALLSEAELPFYETYSGRWRISVAAIWLERDDDYPQARALLDEYQVQRQSRVREHYESLRAEGMAPTLWGRFWGNPLLFIAYAVLVLVVLFFSIYPFIQFF